MFNRGSVARAEDAPNPAPVLQKVFSIVSLAVFVLPNIISNKA